MVIIMEWLGKLRARSIRRALLPFVILVGAAVLVIALSGAYGVVGMLAPKTLAELTPETAAGSYVDDEIYFIYDYVIQETRDDGAEISRYYLVDFDETYYMCLRVYKNGIDEADEMMGACWDYMDGLVGPEDLPTIHVRGTIRAMDDEETRLYYDAADNDPQVTEIMLPIYLDQGRVNGLNTAALVILLAIGAVLLALGLWALIWACAGGRQRDLRRKLASFGDLETEAERAAAAYDSTEPVCGVRMGKEYVFFDESGDTILLRPWDIAWAYQSTTQHRTNGIPTVKTYAVVLRTMDGKSYQLLMSQKKGEELLHAMESALPGTVLGYSQELEEMYKNSRGAFAARWEEKLPGCTARP